MCLCCVRLDVCARGQNRGGPWLLLGQVLDAWNGEPSVCAHVECLSLVTAGSLAHISPPQSNRQSQSRYIAFNHGKRLHDRVALFLTCARAWCFHGARLFCCGGLTCFARVATASARPCARALTKMPRVRVCSHPQHILIGTWNGVRRWLLVQALPQDGAAYGGVLPAPGAPPRVCQQRTCVHVQERSQAHQQHGPLNHNAKSHRPHITPHFQNGAPKS